MQNNTTIWSCIWNCDTRYRLKSLTIRSCWGVPRPFFCTAFYGGTCLHILPGLDRFPEDLDFSLQRFSAALEEEVGPLVSLYE